MHNIPRKLPFQHDPQRARIHFRDPLTERMLTEELRQAVNVLGDGVMVGNETYLWGGKSSACVGIELHDNVRLYPHCKLVVDQISAESGIVVAARVAMNFNCYIEGSGGVHIGAGTILGPNVVIVSSSHAINGSPIQQSGKTFARVTIGENVWIGANAVILAGITIGNGAVVGAASLISKDVPARHVVAGNPATVIRRV